MRLDLTQLIAFNAVITEGSFTKAAAFLGTQQSSVSAKVKLLELRLGTKLFDRTTRFVELTQAGRTFSEHARAVITAMTRAEAIADQLGRSGEKRIRFGYPSCTIFSPSRVRAVEKLQASFPRVNLELVDGLPLPLLDMLMTRRLDFALFPGPLPPGLNVEAIAVQGVENDLLIPENHRYASMKSIPLRMLSGQKVIASPRELHPSLYDQIWGAVECAGAEIVVLPEPHPVIRLRMARQGGTLTMGLGFEIDAAKLAAEGFVARPIDSVRASNELLLVRLRDDHTRLAGQAWDMLKGCNLSASMRKASQAA